MNLFKMSIPVFTVLVLSAVSFHSLASPCGEEIYNKRGKFRKYEYVNLTLSENTKAHGMSSWTFNATTETSTASSDPGVSTGASSSMKQSTSTDGACKWGGFFALNERTQLDSYVAQNISEIKDDIAAGRGGHLEVLASAYQCNPAGREAFPQVLRKNLEKLVDYSAEQSEAFEHSMTDIVRGELASQCSSAIF